jgi:hypothetical protein
MLHLLGQFLSTSGSDELVDGDPVLHVVFECQHIGFNVLCTSLTGDALQIAMQVVSGEYIFWNSLGRYPHAVLPTM